MEKFIQIIIYLGAIQGLLLSVFLFSIRLNKISNRLLGVLTLLWGLFLLAFALQEEGLYRKIPHLLKVFYQLLYLFFPLLYLQVKYLLANYSKFDWKDIIHFIPFFLSIIFYLDFFLQSGEEKISLIRNKSEYYIILQIIGDEVIAIQGVVYSILSLILIRKYRQKIKQYESTLDKNIVKVLYIGISLNLFSWIIGIVGIHLEYFKVDAGIDLFAVAYFVLVIIIYIISYAAVKSPEIFKLDINQIRTSLQTSLDQNSTIIFNDKNSSLKDNIVVSSEIQSPDPLLAEIDNRLVDYMQTEKPFLDPELSLPELARMLDIPRNQLSGVINQIHDRNFYEFVNQYRINEVKQLLKDPKNSNYKLISLAYDAGFNSKASFNRIFKQMTQMTPSQYMASQQPT